jgi:hypothetical protein
VVRLLPFELSNEDQVHIWDAVTPSYHLSVSCVARVVRVDPIQRSLRQAGPLVDDTLAERVVELTQDPDPLVVEDAKALCHDSPFGRSGGDGLLRALMLISC